jgi:hypothetical protein
LDVYWENAVLGLIGETIDEDGQICGCRIVDKSKKTPMYRIELWYRSQNKEVGDKLKHRLVDVLTDSDTTKSTRGGPIFTIKPH